MDKVFGNPRVYLQGVPPSGDLNEYYTKPEMDDILSTNYWTKFEVAQAIAEIQTMDIEVLSELPPISAAQEYTIYLVPAPSSEIGNFYDEYLVINQQFEQVGSTAVDLSDYVKNEQLSGYMPTSGRLMRTGPFTLSGGYQDSQSLFVVTNYGLAAGLQSNAGNYGGAVAVGYKCTAGQYAQVFGSECSSTGLNLNNTLFGFGLSTTYKNKAIYGKYNFDTDNASIIIGCGTAGNDRANAIEIKDDKSIHLLQNTDIDKNLNISGAISCPSGISLNIDGTIGKFVQGYAVGSTEWNNTGTASFAAGTSKVTGTYSFAAGDNNNVQGNYCSALGRTNTVAGLYNIGAGLSNSVAGAYNSVFGYACSAAAQRNYCLVVGNYSYAGDNCQLVTGRYNVTTTGARVTGNGTNTTDRKNIEVLDWDGNLWIAGSISTAGKQNITLSSLSGIVPSEGKVMKFTLSAADEISFDVSSLTANNTVDFELQLIQPSTAVTVTWPSSGIIWGEDGHFSSSNLAPDLTTGNTLYDFSIRWNGTRFLINLAYTEEIGQ